MPRWQCPEKIRAPAGHQCRGALFRSARAVVARQARLVFGANLPAVRRPRASRSCISTNAGWARWIAGDAIRGFQVKRVRSGVEALLAALRREPRSPRASPVAWPDRRSSSLLRWSRLRAGEAFCVGDSAARTHRERFQVEDRAPASTTAIERVDRPPPQFQLRIAASTVRGDEDCERGQPMLAVRVAQTSTVLEAPSRHFIYRR